MQGLYTIYHQTLGLNLGYKSTETKNAAGTAVVLKGNTTYAGIMYRF